MSFRERLITEKNKAKKLSLSSIDKLFANYKIEENIIERINTNELIRKLAHGTRVVNYSLVIHYNDCYAINYHFIKQKFKEVSKKIESKCDNYVEVKFTLIYFRFISGDFSNLEIEWEIINVDEATDSNSS